MSTALGDILSCPICMDECSKPRALPCLHTFCESCLFMHSTASLADDTNGRIYHCPSCRYGIALPDNVTIRDWIYGLPLNHLYVTLKDTMVINETNGNKCRIHPHKETELFCWDHLEEVCVTCSVLSHRTCAHLVEINAALETEKMKTFELLQEKDLLLKQSEQVIRDIQIERDIFVQNVLHKKTLIKRIKQSLIEEVLRQENVCMQRLDDALQKHLLTQDQMLKECRKSVESTGAEIRSLHAFSGAPLSTVATRRRDVENHVQNCQKKLQNLAKTNKTQINLPPSNAILENFGKLNLFGLVIGNDHLQGHLMGNNRLQGHHSVPARRKNNKATPPGPSESSVSVNSVSDKIQTMALTNGDYPVFVQNTYVKQEKDKRNCKITGVTCLKTGLLILVDNNNGSIKVHDSGDKFLCSFTFSSKPWDAAGVSENKVAITFPDDKLIQFLRIDAGRLKPAKGIIRSRARCYGISSSNDKIAVVSGGESETIVEIFGIETRELINVWTSKVPAFEYSALYCCLFPLGDQLIMVDQPANEVICMSIFGDLVWTCNLRHSNSCGPTFPIIVHGDILVSCSTSNTIVHISSDGKVIRSYFKDSAVRPSVIGFDASRSKLFLSQMSGKEDDNFYKMYSFCA